MSSCFSCFYFIKQGSLGVVLLLTVVALIITTSPPSAPTVLLFPLPSPRVLNSSSPLPIQSIESPPWKTFRHDVEHAGGVLDAGEGSATSEDRAEITNSSSDGPPRIEAVPPLRLVNVARPSAPISHLCDDVGVGRLRRRSADAKRTQQAVSKYTRYVEQYCASSGMMQMHISYETYVRIVRRIARLANVTRNSAVLDVGSGCGTMLNLFYLWFNSSGLGVDVTPSAVEYAQRHAQLQQRFCRADVSDPASLKDIPSNSFDAVVSWSVLHHIRRKLAQCAVAEELVRVVKPGGLVYLGHLRGEMSQSYWSRRKCRVANATFLMVMDYRAFKMETWRRHKFPSLLFRKHQQGSTTGILLPEQDTPTFSE